MRRGEERRERALYINIKRERERLKLILVKNKFDFCKTNTTKTSLTDGRRSFYRDRDTLTSGR